MKLVPMFLLAGSLLNSSILLDNFKLNRIDKYNEEITEEEIKNKERNALLIKEISRKFKNRKYLETIKLIDRNIDRFHGKSEENLLLLELESMRKRKEFSSVVRNAEGLDSRNKFTGVNVAKMHILLARVYLETKNFTKFDTEITILEKNFSKDKEISETISVLQAWRNLEKGNLTKTVNICERVLVETKNLDIGSEAGLVLTIVKNKLGEGSGYGFIEKIVKFNPEFFPKNPTFVTEHLELFTNQDNQDYNILVLEGTIPMINAKREPKSYRKTVFALVEQLKHKKDWGGALEHLKELRNHIQGIELLEDKISMEIDKISILNGTKTIEIVLKENKPDKNKYEYFQVFKLMLDYEKNRLEEILPELERYKEIRSKTFKKHGILNKYDYLKDVMKAIFIEYIERNKNKEDTSIFTEKRIRGLFERIKGDLNELVEDKELAPTLLKILNSLKEYSLNKTAYEKYKDSDDVELNLTVAKLLFGNNDIEELISISERMTKHTRGKRKGGRIEFYEYLVHGYKFKRDKLKLKQTIDAIVDDTRHIKNENILPLITTYYTFLNEGEPFGGHTDKEIEKTIYRYLSASAQHPESKLNEENKYRFFLINRLLKRNSYNETKFILDSLRPKDDEEKSKRNYFYMKYYDSQGDKKNLEEKRNECKKLSDNEWKEKCLNFK